jgi:hypothetical protein
MRTPAAQVVTRFICDKRIVAKTKAFRGGIVGWD